MFTKAFNYCRWPFKIGVEFDTDFGLGLALTVEGDYIALNFLCIWPQFYIEYSR